MARRTSRQLDASEVARVACAARAISATTRGVARPQRGGRVLRSGWRRSWCPTSRRRRPPRMSRDPTLGSIRGPMIPDASRARHDRQAVIPIRAFALGKARLAAALDGAERAALGRRWAEQVVHAAGGLPVVVVSSDPDVRVWAAGARPRPCSTIPARSTTPPTPGAISSVAAGAAASSSPTPISRVPRSRGVVRDGSQPVVTIVPCHRDDGTPVLSVPVDRRLPLRLRARIRSAVTPPKRAGWASGCGSCATRPRVRRRRARRPGGAGHLARGVCRRRPRRDHDRPRAPPPGSSRSAPTPTTSSSGAARRSRSGRAAGARASCSC